MSDYLRSALGYLNGGTAGNEYVGQTLEINNVRLRVTRLIAEGESTSAGRVRDRLFLFFFFFPSNLRTRTATPCSFDLSPFVPTSGRFPRARRVKDFDRDSRRARGGKGEKGISLSASFDMCQTRVLTRGQTRVRRRMIVPPVPSSRSRQYTSSPLCLSLFFSLSLFIALSYRALRPTLFIGPPSNSILLNSTNCQLTCFYRDFLNIIFLS